MSIIEALIPAVFIKPISLIKGGSDPNENKKEIGTLAVPASGIDNSAAFIWISAVKQLRYGISELQTDSS